MISFLLLVLLSSFVLASNQNKRSLGSSGLIGGSKRVRESLPRTAKFTALKNIAEAANSTEQDDNIDYETIFDCRPVSAKPGKIDSNSTNILNNSDGIWDTEAEAEWEMSSFDFNQILAANHFACLESFLDAPINAPIENLENDRYSFKNNWPFLGPDAPKLSTLSERFQLLAIKALINPCQNGSFDRLLQFNLVAFDFPVQDIQTNSFKTLLSFALDQEIIIEEKIDILLKYFPKHLLNFPSTLELLTPLDICINTNNILMAHKLITAGADMNSASSLNLRTPFMNAIIQKNLLMIDFLLSTRMFDLNIILNDKTDAITLAALHLNSEYLGKILSFPSNLKLEGKSFVRILNNLYKTHPHLLRVVARQAVQVQNRNYMSILTPFTVILITSNDVENVRLFHSIGVPIDQDASFKLLVGYHFIHLAVARGHIEMVNLLLDLGVKVDSLTDSEKKNSPLIVAYKHRKFNVAAELLKRGAIVGLDSCIQHAIIHDITEMLEIVRLSSKYLTKLTLSNGFNPLTFAVHLDKPCALKLLLKSQKFSPLIEDANGKTLTTISIPLNASDELQKILKKYR